MKRRRLLLLLAVLILLGGIIFSTTRGGPAEPMYQGQELSKWIEGVPHSDDGGFNTNYLLIVRAIGSNAVPWLLNELDARDSVLKVKFNEFAERRGWAFRLSTSASIRHRRAFLGFLYIGPRARGAIPQLVQRIGKDWEFRQGSIELALTGLAHRGTVFQHDEAAADLPAIRREIIDLVRPVADESDLNRRLAAMQILVVMIPDTGEAVPVFLHALKSTNEIERARGAIYLGSLAKEPVSVIPVLIAALDDPSFHVREAAASALGNYHRQAHTAVPALLNLTTNGAAYVRRAASDALLKIDPDATADADLKGVK